jgi:hypothetical protein
MVLACLVLVGATRAADDERFKELEKRLNAVEKQNADLKSAQKQQQIDGSVGRAIAKVGGGAVLAADRPDIKGVGLSFTGEYLYWNVQRSKDVIAQWSDQNGLPPFGATGNTEQGSFDWGSGFRLGLNYQLPYDGWDVGAAYTYFRTDGKRSIVDADTADAIFLQVPAIGPGNTFFPGWADRVTSSRKFSYDKFDLELGRNSKLTDSLSLRLHAGPSFSWIDMDTDVNYYGINFPGWNGTTYGFHHNNTVEASLYGLRIGADGEMKLKHGLSLVAKASGALYAAETKYRTREAYDLDGDGAVDTNEHWADTKMDDHRIIPAVDFEAGVAWEKKINDNLNFKVYAGYQFTNYFGLYERRALGADATEVNSDIGMHGMVLRVHLDF